MPEAGRVRWVSLPIVMLGCAVVLSATLTYPFNNDNALYAYMADLVLHGRWPYTGSWDQNFPAIILIHLPQILLLGHSQIAFHIWDTALQLCGAFVLYQTASAIFDRRAGALAAITSVLYYVHQGLWMAGERDTYVTSLLIWAVLLAVRSRPRWFVAGLLLGLCVLFRPTYVGYSIVMAGWVLFYRGDMTGSCYRSFGRVLFGAALPLLLLGVGYLIFGGFRDLWEATVLFNLKIYSGTGASFNIWEPIRFYLPNAVMALGGAWLLWRRQKREELMLMLGLWIASLVSLIVLYRHSVYHYHPMMVILLMFAAGGWVQLMDYFGARWNRRVAEIVVLSVLLLYSLAIALRGNTIQHVLVDLANGRIHTFEAMYAYYEGSPEFGENVQTNVAKYLEQHTTQGSVVQMFGPYSYPQYASGTMSASRFQTLHALTMRGTGDSLQSFQLRWRSEYMSDLSSARPIYFIVCDAPEAFRQYYGGRLGHEILRDDFRELGIWLNQNYSRETKIGAFTLYRLVRAPSEQRGDMSAIALPTRPE